MSSRQLSRRWRTEPHEAINMRMPSTCAHATCLGAEREQWNSAGLASRSYRDRPSSWSVSKASQKSARLSAQDCGELQDARAARGPAKRALRRERSAVPPPQFEAHVRARVACSLSTHGAEALHVDSRLVGPDLGRDYNHITIITTINRAEARNVSSLTSGMCIKGL